MLAIDCYYLQVPSKNYLPKNSLIVVDEFFNN